MWNASARYSAMAMSQPTSRRVACLQSVDTASTAVTTTPTAAEMNSRGRASTTRAGKGGRRIAAPLILHRARGEAGDVVVDEERIDDRHRHGAQQRRGHELAPVEDVAPDQLGDGADGHR